MSDRHRLDRRIDGASRTFHASPALMRPLPSPARSALLAGVMAAAACAPPGTTATLELTYLGAAGWRITDGEATVLVDPYLSRLKYGGAEFQDPDDARPPASPTDTIAPDTAVILRHIRQADYILVHHTHFDHAYDVPFIARRTDATVIGTASTARLLRAYGVPEDRIRVVGGGERLDLGDLTVRAIPSIHTDFGGGVPPSPEIPAGIARPVRLADLVEGGSLIYELRIGDASVVTMGSMNFLEEELDGLAPDIAIIGAHTIRRNVPDYTRRLLEALDYPETVVPTHWDNYRVPYGADQTQRYDTHVRSLMEEIREIAPETRVIGPVHLEPFTVAVEEPVSG